MGSTTSLRHEQTYGTRGVFCPVYHLHIRVIGTLEMLLIRINTFCSLSVHLLQLFTMFLYIVFVWFDLHSELFFSPLSVSFLKPSLQAGGQFLSAAEKNPLVQISLSNSFTILPSSSYSVKILLDP